MHDEIRTFLRNYNMYGQKMMCNGTISFIDGTDKSQGVEG